MGIGSRRDSFLTPINLVDRVRCPAFGWIVYAAGRAEPYMPGMLARMAWHAFSHGSLEEYYRTEGSGDALLI